MSNERYKPTLTDKAKLKIQPETLKVSGDGVFHTIQGEGVSIGRSAVFLRLHFCNLACDWCDTKYTWDTSKKEFWQESQDWSIDQTVAKITQFQANRLVVTGGEPLIQQKGLEQVVKRLDGWNTELETNGTLAPDEFLAENVQFNVSPKLAHSANSKIRRFRPEVLKTFNALDKTTFKFVAKGPSDFEEIDQIVDECNLDPEKMIIMPEGTTPDALREHGLAIIDSVKARNWRMLPRFHVMLWGNQRGI
jgi:organic radical activating enzyme